MSTTTTTTTAAAPATVALTGAGPVSEMILHFFLWDTSQNTIKDAFYLKCVQPVVDTGTLADVRRLLASSAAQKEYATFLFCSSTGSKVPDTWKMSDYLALDKAQTQEASSAASTTKPSQVKIYLQQLMDKTTSSRDPLPIPSLSDVNTTLPTTAKPTTPEKLEAQKSSYDRAQYQATGDELSYASDLTAKDWGKVTQNNALLYGFGVIRQKATDGSILATGVGIARRPAFQFKERQVALDALAYNNIETTTLSLRMPSFIVDDQSYVSVYETSNTFQSSMAYSAFAEADVKVAASGGAFGVSVGVSAGYAQSSSSSGSSAAMQASNRMNISYNFPRVTLFLDDESMELTEQCKRDLALVTDTATLTTFLNMYGQFFATRVQLGGRLFASDESSTVAGSNASDKAKSMKVSASVSFSSSYASGAASASYGSSSSSSSTSSSSNSASSLTWQANGGNTLLANNPAAWCSTVGSFQNWRITRQDGVLQLMDVIGKMSGYTQTPALMSKLTSTAALTAPVAQADEIYLPSNSSTNPKGYFVMTAASRYSTASALQYCVKAGTVPSSASSQVTGLQNIGAVSAGYTYPDARDRSMNFQVLNLDRSPCAKAKSETKYILRGTSTGLYIGYYIENGRTWPIAGTEPCAVLFRLASGTKTVAPITNATLVRIIICDSVANTLTSDPTELGAVYINCATDYGTCLMVDQTGQKTPESFSLERHVAG